MGFRNSSAYVQRQIDALLREFRDFARIYVDDIVIFSYTLENYMNYLRKMFTLFQKYNIVIKLFKIFLRYSFVALLK